MIVTVLVEAHYSRAAADCTGIYSTQRLVSNAHLSQFPPALSTLHRGQIITMRKIYATAQLIHRGSKTTCLSSIMLSDASASKEILAA